MFTEITPEQAGISSRSVAKFIQKMEQRGLYNHSVLLARGDRIFCEGYWAPYNADSLNRLYSQTKSFEGIAICLLADEGKLSLDDRIVDHFPEKIHREIPAHLSRQTIRHMLNMQTCLTDPAWFADKSAVDRTEYYLNKIPPFRNPGLVWQYDSAGSQVLTSLVEKLSGMRLLDYLKEKLFNAMGTFSTARILKTRNGDSWGDSALLCTLRDVASFGWLLMNGGKYGDTQLIPEALVQEAIAKQVDCDETGFGEAFHADGYGYQIWHFLDGFAFVGMGGQLTVAFPQRDLLFSITGDNQGYPGAYSLILACLQDFILDELQDSPLPENPEAFAELQSLLSSLQLKHIPGPTESAYQNTLNGVRYICEENRMDISEFSFRFDSEDTGVFCYRNAQGYKELPFGLGKNVFGKFPQWGYSDEYGGLSGGDDFFYDCAASAAWREEQKLVLKVQIIDKYLGNFFAIFSFRDGDACVHISKTAEDFLHEYYGWINAKAE